MKNYYINRILILMFVSFVGTIPSLANPKEIRFQGRLTDNLGNPIAGSTDVRFQIKAGDGILLWTFDKEVDANESGLFSEVLGDFTELEKFSQHEDYYLHISIKAPGGSLYHALEPPQKLASVPFSFQSVNSEKAELAVEIEPDKITTDKILDGEVMEDDLKKPVIEVEHLKDGSVTGRALANQSVDAIHIKDSSIGGYKLVESTITTREIEDRSIEREDIKQNAISTDEIDNGTITEDDLGENSVATANIVNDTIESEDINDGAIEVVDLNSNVQKYFIPAGMIAMFDASCPDGWLRFDALDDKFPLGASSYTGNPGGSNFISGLTTGADGTHDHPVPHQHGKGTLSTNQTTQSSFSANGPGSPVTFSNHTHTITGNTSWETPTSTNRGNHNHPVSSNGSWKPLHLGVVYCKKL